METKGERQWLTTSLVVLIAKVIKWPRLLEEFQGLKALRRNPLGKPLVMVEGISLAEGVVLGIGWNKGIGVKKIQLKFILNI